MLEPGPFIQTLSGRRVNPLDAAPEDIDPADIARALSNLCRFGGHSKAFYSVAQHSAIVCDLLEERGATPDELMAALLHDAAEAYLGDLPHPLKHRSELGAAFRVAEKRLEAVIAERFALPEAAARIKPLDKALLATERRTSARSHGTGRSSTAPRSSTSRSSRGTPPAPCAEFTARYERIDALGRRLVDGGWEPARANTSSARRSSSGCSGQRLNASRSGRSVVRTMNAVTSAMRSPRRVSTSSANGRCVPVASSQA